MSNLTVESALAIHRTMCRIRYFEEAASAKYKNGTLQVSLPKAEEVKPESHSIKIN